MSIPLIYHCRYAPNSYCAAATDSELPASPRVLICGNRRDDHETVDAGLGDDPVHGSGTIITEV